MSKLNWEAVHRLQKETYRPMADGELYEAWEHRHAGGLRTKEAITALSREIDYRDNIDQWRKAGRQFGIPEADLGAWVAFIDEQPDNTLFKDMYEKWKNLRK